MRVSRGEAAGGHLRPQRLYPPGTDPRPKGRPRGIRDDHCHSLPKRGHPRGRISHPTPALPTASAGQRLRSPSTAAPPLLLTVWHSRVSVSAGSHSSLSLRSQCSSSGCSPPLSHTSMAVTSYGATPPTDPPLPCLPPAHPRRPAHATPPTPPTPMGCGAARSPFAAAADPGTALRPRPPQPPPPGVCGGRGRRVTPASCAPRPYRPAAAPRPHPAGRQSGTGARTVDGPRPNRRSVLAPRTAPAVECGRGLPRCVTRRRETPPPPRAANGASGPPGATGAPANAAATRLQPRAPHRPRRVRCVRAGGSG